MPIGLSGLISAVGADLDTTIDANSVPSTTQVQQWLLDAYIKLLKILPNDLVMGVTETLTGSSVGASMEIEGDSMRIISVKKYGAKCTRYAPGGLDRAIELTPMLHSEARPAFELTSSPSSPGCLILKFWPESSGVVKVVAIKQPSLPSSWGESDAFSPPPTWAELLVGYAVMKGKMQDEEPELAKLAYELWERGVQIHAEGGDIGGEDT